MKKALPAALFLILLCLPSFSQEFVPGEIIVKFNSDPVLMPEGVKAASPDQVKIKSPSITDLNQKYRVSSIKKVFPDAKKPESIVRTMKSGEIIEVPDFTRFFLLKVPEDTDIISAVEEYSNDKQIEFAQPNYIVKAFLVPNDTSYAVQWALPKVNAPGAWDISTGTGEVIVADVDTGVDYLHEDLLGKIVIGYDYENGDANPMDDNGHGTHVAGIIGAITNNAKGIAGLGWNTRVMAVKVLDSGGGGTSGNVSNGIRYAADNGAQIINMSFGGSVRDLVIESACTYAYGKGCILCAAAGNENTESPVYPAALSNVIAVAATDQNDQRGVWGGALASNYGAWVDISAPGSTIYSTDLAVYGSYSNKNGTSMATPYVAALAALLLARNPSWTQTQVQSRIENTADNIDAENPGYEGKLGAGRINAERAMGVPEASISSPASGDIISGTQAVTGTADLDTDLAYYTVYIGAGTSPTSYTSLFTGTSSVKEGALGSFDTTAFSDGIHTLKLEAVSNEPYTSEATAQVTIDNSPPTTEVTSPSSGESVSGTVIIRGTATDPNLDYYRLEYTDTLGIVTIHSSSSAVVNGELGSWNTSGLSGSYNLRLLAVDRTGLSSSVTVPINVTSGAASDLKLLGLVNTTPNPFDPTKGDDAYFHYELSDNANIEIYIFDLDGELIWKKSYPAGSNGGKAGENLAPWNGKNSYGETIQNGVYFYKLVSASNGRSIIGSGRIIILR